MTLIENMTKVYDRVYGISDKLGVNTHVNFSYKDRAGNVVNVTPRPRLSNPPAHKLVAWEKQGNVEVNASDKYVTGISRTYGTIIEGTICTIDGRTYSILWVDREQTVTYNLLVRPERVR